MCDIAVCDDSAIDRKNLIERINRIAVSQSLQIYEFSSGEALLKAMKNNRFAAVFLDIQMKGMSGDDTAKKIRELDSTVVLAFYTGFSALTPERLEVLPFRYLMKNMPDVQLDEYVKATLEKAAEYRDMPVLDAKVQRKGIYINAKYIMYIEKHKKSTRAELAPMAYDIYGIKADENGKYPDVRISDTLWNIYNKLKRYGFGCPHNSYIINFHYMNNCTSSSLKVEGVNTEFPISRSKMKEFNELRKQFICAKYVKTGDDL